LSGTKLSRYIILKISKKQQHTIQSINTTIKAHITFLNVDVLICF